MQYLIEQLKKYRVNEGGSQGLSLTMMYTGGSIGGFSSAFLSPYSVPTSNTVGGA